jgi:hypothetical protein
MHVLGKVFMVFAFLLVVTAVVLTTMLLDIRSNWKKRFETALVAAQKSEDDLRIETQKLRALEEQQATVMHNWGEAWLARNSGPQGQGGIANFGVGSAQGLGLKATQQNKPAPEIYAFALNGVDKAEYIGEFKSIRLQLDNVTGELTRPPYSGEEATWPNGDYRIRDTIPSGWLHLINELTGQIDVAQRHLVSQRENLAVLTKQIEESQKSLDQRLQELNGDPDAPAGASQEVVDGLVQTVRRLETERNTVLASVHKLRHELNNMYVQLRETMDANRQMADKVATSAGVTAQTTPATKPQLTASSEKAE